MYRCFDIETVQLDPCDDVSKMQIFRDVIIKNVSK